MPRWLSSSQNCVLLCFICADYTAYQEQQHHKHKKNKKRRRDDDSGICELKKIIKAWGMWWRPYQWHGHAAWVSIGFKLAECKQVRSLPSRCFSKWTQWSFFLSPYSPHFSLILPPICQTFWSSGREIRGIRTGRAKEALDQRIEQFSFRILTILDHSWPFKSFNTVSMFQELFLTAIKSVILQMIIDRKAAWTWLTGCARDRVLFQKKKNLEKVAAQAQAHHPNWGPKKDAEAMILRVSFNEILWTRGWITGILWNSNRISLAESCRYQFCCCACAAGLMTEKEVLAPSLHFIPPTAHRSQMLTVLKYTLYVRNCQKLSEYIVRQYVAQVWTQDTRRVFLRMCESYVVRPDKGHDGKREGQREATARIRSGHVREMVSLVSQSHFGNLGLSLTYPWPILGLSLAYPWPILFGLFRRPPGQTANPERNAGSGRLLPVACCLLHLLHLFSGDVRSGTARRPRTKSSGRHRDLRFAPWLWISWVEISDDFRMKHQSRLWKQNLKIFKMQ